MIQQLDPHCFSNDFIPQPPRPDALTLVFSGELILCGGTDEAITLPRLGELSLPAPPRYAFTIDDAPVFLSIQPPAVLPEGYSFRKVNRLAQPRHLAWAMGVGASLARWYQSTRHCGACGGHMTDSTTERAMVCTDCGAVVYPKICPAVIVAITDGDRILLTRYAGRAFKSYALVAGFNEIGESIEDTVHREVFEETGLRVKELRYYRSQPWVFTDSLLMGFFARLDGSDVVRLQRSELSEAGWFPREALPADHSAISLTGEMMELFRDGREP